MQHKIKGWKKGVKQRFKHIGPWLQVPDDFVANMQAAYDTDCECGTHWMGNEKSHVLEVEFPTVVAMARTIEEERNTLKKLLRQLTTNRKRQKYGKERR